MNPDLPGDKDLILNVETPESAADSEPRMPLIDAPRIDRERAPDPGFSWKPTLVLIAVGGAALFAYAYL